MKIIGEKGFHFYGNITGSEANFSLRATAGPAMTGEPASLLLIPEPNLFQAGSPPNRTPVVYFSDKQPFLWLPLVEIRDN